MEGWLIVILCRAESRPVNDNAQLKGSVFREGICPSTAYLLDARVVKLMLFAASKWSLFWISRVRYQQRMDLIFFKWSLFREGFARAVIVISIAIMVYIDRA